MLLNDLQKGDLLFQLRSGGELEWIISRVFAGYNGMALNHVAICTEADELVEAVMPEVRVTTLDNFIDHAVLDGLDRPCILQARLLPEYSGMIEVALEFVQEQLYQPYNSDYGSARKGWYCSELVLEAFRYANAGDYLFPQTLMGFRDLETGSLFPYWVEFYRKLGKPVPEGEPGSHPALLSCSSLLNVVRVIGQLPARVNQSSESGQLV